MSDLSLEFSRSESDRSDRSDRSDSLTVWFEKILPVTWTDPNRFHAAKVDHPERLSIALGSGPRWKSCIAEIWPVKFFIGGNFSGPHRIQLYAYSFLHFGQKEVWNSCTWSPLIAFVWSPLWVLSTGSILTLGSHEKFRKSLNCDARPPIALPVW